MREDNKRREEDKNALDAGAVFTPSEETEFNHIRQKLDRDISPHYMLYRKAKDGKLTLQLVKRSIKQFVEYLN